MELPRVSDLDARLRSTCYLMDHQHNILEAGRCWVNAQKWLKRHIKSYRDFSNNAKGKLFRHFFAGFKQRAGKQVNITLTPGYIALLESNYTQNACEGIVHHQVWSCSTSQSTFNLHKIYKLLFGELQLLHIYQGFIDSFFEVDSTLISFTVLNISEETLTDGNFEESWGGVRDYFKYLIPKEAVQSTHLR